MGINVDRIFRRHDMDSRPYFRSGYLETPNRRRVDPGGMAVHDIPNNEGKSKRAMPYF